jgi:Pvc16 N-terminal domain
MADSSALGDVSKSLQNLLRSAITDSADFLGVPVDLRSPKDLRSANVAGPIVSLWLYRITRMDELYNVPPVHIPPNRTVMRPLPLNLSYLVTPIATDVLTAHRLLGRAMQAMFDNAILDSTFIEPALVNSGVKSLTIHMEPHSLDELTRIWHALQEPYDLSNAYLVQFVPITSRREQPEPSPVLVKTTRYADILEAN